MALACPSVRVSTTRWTRCASRAATKMQLQPIRSDISRPEFIGRHQRRTNSWYGVDGRRRRIPAAAVIRADDSAPRRSDTEQTSLFPLLQPHLSSLYFYSRAESRQMPKRSPITRRAAFPSFLRSQRHAVNCCLAQHPPPRT